MIEKIIHYVWLGNSPKGKVANICINSWYCKLKDYKIYEWNESNLDLQTLRRNSKFLDKCLSLKLWAFASDYLRLWILYEYGGIYLDTDVQIINNFDLYLENDSFFGMEKNGYIGTGIIGAQKNSAIIKRILDFYDSDFFLLDIYTGPEIVKYIYDNENNIFNKTVIANEEIFSPIDLFDEKSFPKVKTNTISIHWYTANWNMTIKGELFLRTKNTTNIIKKVFIALKIVFRRFFKGE